MEFPWWAIERERKGAFEWERADLIVDGVSAAGIDLVPVIVFTPDWATRGCVNPYTDCRTGRRAATCPAQPSKPADFADFVFAIAGRYRGRIRFWELWNEPDLPNYFAGTATDYGHLLLAPGYEAIKKADADAQVVFGGPSSPNADWVEKASDAAGNRFDILTYHDYGSVGSAPTTAATMAALAEGRPVWLAEFGTERSSSQRDLMSAIFDRDSPLDAAIWYELRDDDIFSGTTHCGSQTFGLLDRNYRPKPSFPLFRSIE